MGCGTVYGENIKMKEMFQIGNPSKTAAQDFADRYELGEPLEREGSWTRYECLRLHDEEKMICKIMNKNRLTSEEIQAIYEEVRILSKLSHPNLLQETECFESERKIWVIEERLRGKELFDAIIEIGHFSENNAAKMLSTLAQAIGYMHAQGIVHRDLKPEHLQFAKKGRNAAIKITHFHLAARCKEDTSGLDMLCGSPEFIAPEILKQQAYGKKVDIWSLGVILYTMLCGYPPFHDEDESKLYKKIRRGKLDFREDYWGGISDQAKNLVKLMLQVDPEKRISIKDLLAHDWVNGGAKKVTLSSKNTLSLKRRQARQRLRKIVFVLIALNRFFDGELKIGEH